MLGMVFTELLEMAEQQWSPALVDSVLQQVPEARNGSYTTVGYYPFGELDALLRGLAAATGTPTPTLLQQFGHHMFGRFQQLHPQVFAHQRDCFSLLAGVDNHIHREVHKLYPEAELPTFTVLERDANRLTLEYHSRHPLADLAEGLIRACMHHFREPLSLTRTDLVTGDGRVGARFTLIRS